MGMVAHLVFTAWDADNPASLSSRVIGEIIRGRIGFDGLLMTDDIGMHALFGGFDERTRRALDAGCDLALHCSGEMEEMIAVASAAGPLSGRGAVIAGAATAASMGFVDLISSIVPFVFTGSRRPSAPAVRRSGRGRRS